MPPGDRPLGYFATLRAAVNAGSLAGLVLGLVDGLLALLWTKARLGVLGTLGCIAGSVLVYVLVHAAVLVASSPLWHALLRKRSLGVRCRLLFGVGLGWGIAAELYWHSKPYLYWGSPALSKERLVVLAGSLALGLASGWLLARLWAGRSRAARLALELGAIAVPLVGALYLLGQRGAFERAGRGELNERNRDRPNVLLVVVDALRQDVLGAYGNADVRTPNMNRVAEEGARFANAFVQAPFTTTSFGSWLTGKYPRRHGLLMLRPDVVLPDNTTIAWHLKGAQLADGGGKLEEKDYVSAAFMTGAVTHHSRLDKGFDVYSEAMQGHSLVELDSPWSTFRSDLLLSILWNKITQRTDYNKAGTTAAEWLAENDDRRFFAWVHLYSTHTPYVPENPYRGLYADPDYTGHMSDGFWAWDREAIERGEYEPTPADVQQIRDLYYGGVTQADAAIGRLLDVLARKGVLDDTVVIVTSDHGEDLGEGGRWEHNHMVETNLRVPLLVRYPKAIPAGTVVDARVDSIDLLPTICELLRLKLPEDRPDNREDDVDGKSLMPVVRGEVSSVRPYTFAENGPYVSINDGRFKLVLRHEDLDPGSWEQLGAELVARRGVALLPHADECADWEVVRDGQSRVKALHYLARGARARTCQVSWCPLLLHDPPRYFDLESDPAEEDNRFDPSDGHVLALRDALDVHLKRFPIRAIEIDRSARDLEGMLHEFGALGYTHSPGSSAEDE